MLIDTLVIRCNIQEIMEGHTEGVGEGVTAAVISTPSGHIGPIYIRWVPSFPPS